jgi:hypothetical protein
MIRNNAGGSAVRDTAKLIETLKKVGVIKTKKRRARRSLAKDEIRQDNDMGPGYAEALPGFTGPSGLNLVERNFPQLTMGPRPLLGGGGDQQGGFNPAQIEDVKRNQIQQFGLLQDQIQKQAERQMLFQQGGLALSGRLALLQQRLDRPEFGAGTADPFANVKGSGDAVESAEEEGQESDDQEMEKVGPNANISEDVKTTTTGGGFVDEESNVFPSVVSPPEPASPPPAIASASAPEPASKKASAPKKRKEAETPIGTFLSPDTLEELDNQQLSRPQYKSVGDLMNTLREYAERTGQEVPNVEANQTIYKTGRKEDKTETIKRLLNKLIQQNRANLFADE